MSDLENFSYVESSNTGSSAESFRLFQERMKVAAAQIRDIRAGEKKQRKKEDELAKILANFIATLQGDSAAANFLVYISGLLARNLPASFILVLLIINFPSLQEQTGLKLISFQQAARAGALDVATTLPDLYWRGQQLPPAIRIAIDSWIAQISSVAGEHRQKLLDRALNGQGHFLDEIHLLATHSLDLFLNSSGLSDQSGACRGFTDYFLNQILAQIKNPPLSLAQHT